MKKSAWAFVSGALIVMFGMAQLTVPNTFVTGTPISSSAMNANFDLVESEALNRTGGTITGNIAVSNGITIDGRDISTMGAWTAVTYSAGNFTSSSGTWTVGSGDQITYAYTTVGKTMTVAFYIAPTDVTGTPGFLQIAIPNSAVSTGYMQNVVYAIDNGVGTFAVAGVDASGTVIKVSPFDSAWAASSGGTYIQGQISFQIN